MSVNTRVAGSPHGPCAVSRDAAERPAPGNAGNQDFKLTRLEKIRP